MPLLTNVNLTGYRPVVLANSQTNAGGVGVYVADKFTVTLLDKNELELTLVQTILSSKECIESDY